MGSEGGVELVVHLMLGEPQREHGHLVGEVEELDAIELVEGDVSAVAEVHYSVAAALLLQPDDVHLEEAQCLVGDDEEVAAAAGGVEKFHAAHAQAQLMAALDDGAAVVKEFARADGTHVEEFLLTPVEGEQARIFGPQAVHEERVDDLHDVGHAGIVHTLLGAHVGIDHGLDHRAEDVGIDVFPVEVATFEDDAACLGPHARYRDVLGE